MKCYVMYKPVKVDDHLDNSRITCNDFNDLINFVTKKMKRDLITSCSTKRTETHLMTTVIA